MADEKSDIVIRLENLAKVIRGGHRVVRCDEDLIEAARLISSLRQEVERLKACEEALKRTRGQWIHSVNTDACSLALGE